MDINKERLLDSIFMLGKIGIDASGERTRKKKAVILL